MINKKNKFSLSKLLSKLSRITLVDVFEINDYSKNLVTTQNINFTEQVDNEYKYTTSLMHTAKYMELLKKVADNKNNTELFEDLEKEININKIRFRTSAKLEDNVEVQLIISKKNINGRLYTYKILKAGIARTVEQNCIESKHYDYTVLNYTFIDLLKQVNERIKNCETLGKLYELLNDENKNISLSETMETLNKQKELIYIELKKLQ